MFCLCVSVWYSFSHYFKAFCKVSLLADCRSNSVLLCSTLLKAQEQQKQGAPTNCVLRSSEITRFYYPWERGLSGQWSSTRAVFGADNQISVLFLLRVIVHTFVLDVNDAGIIPGRKLLVYFVIVRVSLWNAFWMIKSIAYKAESYSLVARNVKTVFRQTDTWLAGS